MGRCQPPGKMAINSVTQSTQFRNAFATEIPYNDAMNSNQEPIIVIYRTSDRKPRPLTKAQKLAIEEKLATARIQRPELLDFFMANTLATMEPLPEQYRNAPRLRTLHKTAKKYGWIVPVSCYGRGAAPTQSMVNSIRLWVKQNVGIDGDQFMLVIEN